MAPEECQVGDALVVVMPVSVPVAMTVIMILVPVVVVVVPVRLLTAAVMAVRRRDPVVARRDDAHRPP